MLCTDYRGSWFKGSILIPLLQNLEIDEAFLAVINLN